jgi:hypothetical protein
MGLPACGADFLQQRLQLLGLAPGHAGGSPRGRSAWRFSPVASPAPITSTTFCCSAMDLSIDE